MNEPEDERSISCNLPFDDLSLRVNARDVAKNKTREFIKNSRRGLGDLQLRQLPQKAPRARTQFREISVHPTEPNFKKINYE